MLASYHVLDPKTFYEGNDKWDVPQDTSSSTDKQPPTGSRWRPSRVRTRCSR